MTNSADVPAHLQQHRRLVGVDIGGTHIKWARLDGLTVAEADAVDTPTSGPDAVAAVIATIARTNRATHLGVAVPGHLTEDLSATTVIPNVGGEWHGYPLAAQISRLTGTPTALINDARAFAQAELAMGSARNLSGVLFVTLGTGVGGAIAVGGRVLRGPGDRIGEIGHVHVDSDGAVCSCGHRGCLETVAGGRNMAAAWSLLDPDRSDQLRNRRTPADLVAAAMAGQPAAQQVLQAAGSALGQAIGSTLSIMGLDTVLIGGGVAPAFNLMEPAVLDRLQDRVQLIGNVRILRAALGTGAGAIGAALNATPTA